MLATLDNKYKNDGNKFQSIQITVWKFHDFSITQILREITFGGCKCSKNAIFAIAAALKLGFGSVSALRKCEKA